MPKYIPLKPFKSGQHSVNKSIYFNEKEWNMILEVSKFLGYDDLSSVVKESIRLAKIHLSTKHDRVKQIKKLMDEGDIKLRDLDG